MIAILFMCSLVILRLDWPRRLRRRDLRLRTYSSPPHANRESGRATSVPVCQRCAAGKATPAAQLTEHWSDDAGVVVDDSPALVEPAGDQGENAARAVLSPL